MFIIIINNVLYDVKTYTTFNNKLIFTLFEYYVRMYVQSQFYPE